MATIVQNDGGGLLGTLGGLATLGGLIPGAPAWLAPLGVGLGMLGGGSAGGGQGGGSGNSLLDFLTNFGAQLGGGSITGKNTQNTAKTPTQTVNDWTNALGAQYGDPYNRGNGWQRAYGGYY